MKERFLKWFYGESDPMEHILDCAEVPDESREEWKYEEHEIEREISRRVHTQSVIRAERRGFYAFYLIIAVISCLMLIGVLLFTVFPSCPVTGWRIRARRKSSSAMSRKAWKRPARSISYPA